MIKEFSGILLYVKDLDVSAEFYRKLGFDVSLDSFGVGRAVLAGISLQLVQEDKAEFKPQTEMKHKGEGTFFYMHAESVDKTFEELRSAGLTPITDPKDWQWGNREFVLKDPDGYRIIVYQPM